MSTIDVSSLTAFDVHTHVHRSVRADQPPEPGGREDMGEYFGIGTMPRYTVPELADYYRQRNMACVTFTVDSISQTGDEPVPDNFEVAELAAEHADVLIPFASIDPARGAAGVAQARRLVADFGVRGFKFHPGTQAFYPNDRMAYPLYEVIAEHGLVALFHTGQTGVGAGTRGGGGIRLKYSNPLYLDDVAADFPDMDIIMAHPSFPWQDEALSIATHKPRVYIDLSGWSPKYFSPQLVQYAGSLLRHKVLFGTDFPVITPERWIADFENLNIKPEVRPLIMKENAARLFGLSGSEPGPRRVCRPARSAEAARPDPPVRRVSEVLLVHLLHRGRRRRPAQYVRTAPSAATVTRRIRAEAVREPVERLVGPVRLVVGQDDTPDPGALGVVNAHRLVGGPGLRPNHGAYHGFWG